MAWLFILMADVFEVAWPFALKWSVKFSRWSPLIVAIVTSIPVMFLLAEAVKRLPAATVYAGMRATPTTPGLFAKLGQHAAGKTG
jgi:quaternary ammonium compound-resistance protein SugE